MPNFIVTLRIARRREKKEPNYVESAQSIHCIKKRKNSTQRVEYKFFVLVFLNQQVFMYL